MYGYKSGGGVVDMMVDKNLRNVEKDLELNGETRHDAQQPNQARNDRRKGLMHGIEGC